MPIMGDNIVQSEITSGMNDSTYYSTLTINPIRTFDARLYFCIAEFSSFDVTASANVSLPVKLPPPVISININPMDSVYESTQVNLTCSVNTSSDVNTDTNTQLIWIDGGTGNEIESSDRVTVSSVNGSEISVLVFNPVDNGDNGEYDDTGSYICQVTVADDGNNDLVLTTMANESYQLVVEDLPEFPSPSVYYTGSDVIGEMSTLHCNTTVISGLVGDISLSWTKDNEPMIPYNSTSITEATITFDPLSYNDRGRYTCRFTYLSSITNDNVSLSQTHDLNIQIPEPSVVINNNQTDISYTGTVLKLDCVITLSPLVGNPINIATNWYRNGDMNILDNRISSSQLMLSDTNYTSSLSINPLNSAIDSGVYQCNVAVTGDQYVVPANGNDTTNVSVQVLPSPDVSISVVGGQLQLGFPFTLSCSVTVIDGLVVEPITYWEKRSVDNSHTEYISLNEIDDDLVSGNSTLSSYTIPVLRTSDSGNYTCASVLNISTIGVTASSSDSFVIPITLPTPNVSTNFSWKGNFLRISCLIQVDAYINTPVTVDVSWNFGEPGNILSNDSRTVITEPTQVDDSDLYRSDYRLEQPSFRDNGDYECSGTLQPLNGFIHLMNSSEADSSTTSISILAPSEPTNFHVTNTTPTSLLFQWDSPLEPNGPITNYTLTIDYDNGTEILTSTILAESTLEYDLDNLSPYQLITAQLAAYTIAGTGPQSNITARTQQDTPSSVTDLVVSGLDATRAIISWSDVEDPNGVIVQYRVEVQKLESNFSITRTLVGAELNNNVTIDGLSGETPFNVSVFAINGAVNENTSDPARVTFFTVEGVPPPPDGISVIRVNSTHMTVSWKLIPLTVSRGFIEGYVITYATQDSVNKRDTAPIVNVGSSENSAVIGGLQPVVQYTVQVAATTSAGMGDFSDSIMLDSPSSEGFQVSAGPFMSCTDISSSYEDTVIMTIRDVLVSMITDACNCGFSSSYISVESLNCVPGVATQVVYRANITGYNDEYTTTRLIEIIENFISTGPNVTSNSLSFTFDSSCMTQFSEGDEVCGSSTTMPTESTTSTVVTTEDDGILIYVIIGAVVGVLAAFALFLFVLICVIMKYRENKKKENNQNNIELTSYSVVVRKENNGVKDSNVAINGRNSELDNVPLYADTETPNPPAIPTVILPEEALYADVTNVQQPTNTRDRLKVELDKDGNCSLENELYAISKEDPEVDVQDNDGLYATPDEIGTRNGTDIRVVKNVLYSDVDQTDFVPAQTRYDYAVVNKVKEPVEKGEIIENKGFENKDDELPPEYAAIFDRKRSDPINIGSDTVTPSQSAISEDQYEAPWSSKHRSLNRQSTLSEQNTPKEYDDVVVKPKTMEETPKMTEDQYEAPWSSKHRSLNRQSTLSEQNTPKEYDHVVVKPKEMKDTSQISVIGFPVTQQQQSADQPTTSSTESPAQEQPDDTYEVPWANKTRSLGRKQLSLDVNTTQSKRSSSMSTNLPKQMSMKDMMGNDDVGHFVQNEYEIALHPRPLPPHPSMIDSSYDEICIPSRPTGSTSIGTTPPVAQSLDNSDLYSTPVDNLGQQHQSHVPVSKPVLISKNRRRVRSIPSKVTMSATSSTIQEKTDDTDEYSIPFGSTKKTSNPDQDDVYSVPFDNKPSNNNNNNRKVVSFSDVETTSERTERHQSVGEVDAKKRQKLFSFGFKTKNKVTKPSSSEAAVGKGQEVERNVLATTVPGEDLYETISTTGRNSLNQTDYSESPVIPPIPPSRPSIADKSKSSYLNSLQSEYAVPVDNHSTSPPRVPDRPSVAERSKAAYLEAYKKTTKEQKVKKISDAYSDPADIVVAKPPTPNSTEPIEYEAPITKQEQHEITNANSDDTYSDPADTVKAKSPTPSNEPPLEYETPVTKQDTVNIEPYDAVVFGKPDSGDSSEQKDSVDLSNDATTHFYDETSKPKPADSEDVTPVPKIPQPYEIPVSTKDTQPQEDTPQTYEDQGGAAGNVNRPNTDTIVVDTGLNLEQNGAVENPAYSKAIQLNEDDDVPIPKEPQPYEIPVSTKESGTNNDDTAEPQDITPMVPQPYEDPNSLLFKNNDSNQKTNEAETTTE